MLGMTQWSVGLRTLHVMLLAAVIALLRACPEACGESASGGGQSGTANAAADPHLKKVLSFVDEVLGNAGDTERRKVNAIMIVEARSLRQYQPQLERLMKEDASPVVRAKARHTLEFWRYKDAEVARLRQQTLEVRRRAAASPEQLREQMRIRRRELLRKQRDQLLGKLREGKVEERLGVVAVLSEMADGVPEATRVLRDQVMTDSDVLVRTRCLQGVTRADPNSEETFSLCRSCLRSDIPSGPRLVAATHLAGYGRREGLPVLIELLEKGKGPKDRATIQRLLRSVTGLDLVPLDVERVREHRETSEEDARRVEEGVTIWKRWWQQEGQTFILQYARATQPSTRLTTEPGR